MSAKSVDIHRETISFARYSCVLDPRRAQYVCYVEYRCGHVDPTPVSDPSLADALVHVLGVSAGHVCPECHFATTRS